MYIKIAIEEISARMCVTVVILVAFACLGLIATFIFGSAHSVNVLNKKPAVQHG